MGINGLLPFLKAIHEPTHLSAYNGKRVAVDVASWLYKGSAGLLWLRLLRQRGLNATGAYSCALELQQDPQTDYYIGYVMAKVRLLQRNNITPVLVFDGASLPMKVKAACSCPRPLLAQGHCSVLVSRVCAAKATQDDVL